MFRIPVHIVTEEEERKAEEQAAKWWSYLKIWLIICGVIGLICLCIIFSYGGFAH